MLKHYSSGFYNAEKYDKGISRDFLNRKQFNTHAQRSGVVNMATLRSQGGDDKNLNILNNYKNDKNYTNYESNNTKNGYKKHYAEGRIEKIVDEIEEESLEDAHESRESFETPSFFTICLIYLGFYLLMFLGLVNKLILKPKVAKEKNRHGYPPLYEKFAEFYSHYVYRRVRDCWNKPICSVPGATITLKDRITKDHGWTFEFTNTETECLNLSSYNYLGFAENSGLCAEAAMRSIEDYGLAFGTSRSNYGTCPLHVELEKLTAEFLCVEDATTCGMGFATNALNIPTLLSPGCLVLSDEKNHASLILGLRLSGATIRVFRHNNMKNLENLLQEAIVKGQPKCEKHTQWRKIFIFVEGIYSMEGSIVNLPKVIALKKKYKAYLYLDEAHSIGALGKRGRGVVDYFGCDPKDVDILMGTYTKSFGSAGGYIAGSKSLISEIRAASHAQNTASAMSPPVAAQVISAMRIVMGLEGGDLGQKRIEQLARNTRYFRRRVAQMGLIAYGHEDSPVVPILVYLFSKIGVVVRSLQERKIATVGVGFPATPLMQGRIRICLSAAHTKEQLDYALDCLNQIAGEVGIKYSRKPRDPNPIIYEEVYIKTPPAKSGTLAEYPSRYW